MSIAHTTNTGFFKRFWLNPLIFYKRNRVFLSLCLLIVALFLWYTHSITGKPFILSRENMESLGIQFFFYSLLIKISWGLTFYSIISSLFFWWLFYFKALKVDAGEYAIDFILISLWVLFTFVILAAVFFFDLSIVSLKTVLYGLGYNDVDLWQSLTRILAADLHTFSTKDCLTCKDLSASSLDQLCLNKGLMQKEYSQLLFFSLDSPQIKYVVDDFSNKQSSKFNPTSYPKMESTSEHTTFITAAFNKEGKIAACFDTTAVLEQFKPKPSEVLDNAGSFFSKILKPCTDKMLTQGLSTAQQGLVNAGLDVSCTANVPVDQKPSSFAAERKG
uniref:Uncharacterized protein n=1 Tax=Trachydiscus minutus TaxID=1032745 RepID=A0A140F2R8_9STRA|nr:hypothetical protein [Trachydiscus minutus]AML60702.1 hypothetical protein [Trachydiscus minutus]